MRIPPQALMFSGQRLSLGRADQLEIRVLDGRGFNYVTARLQVDFQALERELRLRRTR